MASPQKENGYTPIANEIMEALAKIRISGEEWQVLTVILRKTYGWNKLQDKISMGQMAKATGLKRSNVCRAIKKLLSKKILRVIKKDNRDITTYSFQKDYTKWKPLSKKITVINNDNRVLSKKITKVLSKKIHTKEIENNNTKENIKERKEYMEKFKTEFFDLLIKQTKETKARHKWKVLKLSDDRIKALKEWVIAMKELPDKEGGWNGKQLQYITNPLDILTDLLWEKMPINKEEQLTQQEIDARVQARLDRLQAEGKLKDWNRDV